MPTQLFKKGQTPWNKGIPMTETQKWHLSAVMKFHGIKPKNRFIGFGEDNPNWKGDKVSYSGLHYWLVRRLGSPKVCDKCGTIVAKKYEWANKSGKYKRDITDWVRLCTHCHRIYDKHPWFKRFI